MQRMSARDAKNGFGRLIEIARAEPVAIKKHRRAVVVVVAFEEYEGLTGKKMTARALLKADHSKPKDER
ncbi:MAG: type II toxin-antitoxin system Phd/YefM family antitoxin [Alphaproteobacteria bacterium]|nr:type II toxin-antitoxin system Phd/YefM family antitoxin [Alphaproteobacteria bacterium]